MMIMMYSRGVERKQQNMLTDKYKYKFFFAEKSFKSWCLSKSRFLELPPSALEKNFPRPTQPHKSNKFLKHCNDPSPPA